jgi:hypothetical protein
MEILDVFKLDKEVEDKQVLQFTTVHMFIAMPKISVADPDLRSGIRCLFGPGIRDPVPFYARDPVPFWTRDPR